ncbi:L,D-transpeptidase [Bifidobacterium bifidum]|uniref:L,D-transpeptidase n=1 Tax=Bifidobacterium bifidum TaxID=1681 RepID=UPI0006BFA80C|nr:L,D-transpeptidase [Bifidobacterium bifidum]CUM92560.1 peptidoglycan binding domain [Bifidobacterium bifidum]
MANEYTGDDNQEDERTQAVFPLDDQMNIPPLNMPALHDGSMFDAEPSGLAGLVQETQAKRQADAASAQTQESQETQAFDPLAELDDEAAPEPQPAAPATSSFAPQRPAADDVATVAFAAVAMNPADDAALGKGVSAAKTKNPKRGMIIAFSIIGALLVLLVAAFFGTNWYFQDRVAPGVRFGNVSVMGKTESELTGIVNQAVSDSAITVTDSEGNNVKAGLDKLGVTVNVKQTVRNLLDAKSGNIFTRINPFAKQDVRLSATTDNYKLSTYLTEQLVEEQDRAVASNISYDANSKKFIVTEGNEGKEADPSDVIAAVKKAVSQPGEAQKLSVMYSDVAMPITVETATSAANDANKRLTSSLVIGNSKGKTFTLPADEIAKWIQVKPDIQKGTITLAYDQDAIKTYLSQNLAKKLDQDMVVEKNITNTDGTVLTVTQKGVDGVAVQSTDETAAQVLDALNAGRGAELTATVKVTGHKTESRKVDYTSPNGDPHMVINLSEQKVYAYKGSTLVKTFIVSTGKPSTPTDNGTFFVHTKYQSQTMRGEGYVTPNVPWVTYYNQGEGFHGAPWNTAGIASGTPKSHGCTNMHVEDAKWVYDFLPIGAMVQIVGTTPTSAVR